MQKTAFEAPAAANDAAESKPLRTQRCETCRYSFNNPAAAKENLLDLTCHRMPPRANPLLKPTPDGPRVAGCIAVFPPVFAGEWCGEWASSVAVMQ